MLEAVAACTGIIASRIPPSEELAAHLEIRLFTLSDDADLAEVLAGAWESDAREAIERIKIGVSKCSWDDAARESLRKFESLLR